MALPLDYTFDWAERVLDFKTYASLNVRYYQACLSANSGPAGAEILAPGAHGVSGLVCLFWAALAMGAAQQTAYPGRPVHCPLIHNLEFDSETPACYSIPVGRTCPFYKCQRGAG